MRIVPIFRDRAEAGRILAAQIVPLISETNVLVLALPRGGVPVGFEVARALRSDLDIFLVRKLGAPEQPELAIGALAGGGVRILNEDVIRELSLAPGIIDQITSREQAELEAREQSYRAGRPALPVANRTVVLTDDGLATGASMKAACKALRLQGPRRIVVGVPVAARETCDELRNEVDQLVCVATPEPFTAVGIWYEEFRQLTDDEVKALLQRAMLPTPG